MKPILAAALLLAAVSGARAAPGMAACARATPDAVADCTKLIASNTLSKADLALAYYNRAVAYQAAGLDGHAIDDDAAALRYAPDFFEARYNRGYLLIGSHRYSEALAELQRAAALKPDEPPLHVLIGVAYDNLDRHGLAMQSYDRAVALAPGDANAYGMRGVSHLRYVEPAAAIGDFDIALSFDPKLAFVVSARGSALRLVGRMAEADRAMDQAVALDPRNASLLAHRCWHRAARHAPFAAALKDCDAALHLSPDTADPYDSRGFLYLSNGRNREAVRDYDIALTIDPRYAASLYCRGVARLRMGDDGGRADIARAVSLDPHVAGRLARDGIKP